MIDELQKQLAKINPLMESRSSSSQYRICLSDIAFHLQPFWLKNFVAIVVIHDRDRFQDFAHQPHRPLNESEVAVLFDWILSRHPFLGQVI